MTLLLHAGGRLSSGHNFSCHDVGLVIMQLILLLKTQDRRWKMSGVFVNDCDVPDEVRSMGRQLNMGAFVLSGSTAVVQAEIKSFSVFFYAKSVFI